MTDAITFEEAKSLLDYKDGQLLWNKTMSARAKAGSFAGGLNNRGYLRVCIFGRFYQAHRLVWLLHTGRWPEKVINHLNGIKTDNRIENLESVTHAENIAHAYQHGLMSATRKRKPREAGVAANIN